MSHTDFWIIRHGETDWNAERRLQGWRDIPLNPNGIAQAEALSRHLQACFSDGEPEYIYTSDLQRAYHTALPYARSCDKPIERLPGLRERNYGILEGQLWSSLTGFDSAHNNNLAIELDQNEHKAEDLATFYTRIRQTLNRLAKKHLNETIMIVSHGGAIDMMWRAAGKLAPNAPREFTQRNTSINRLRIISDDSWQILAWADTGHLPQVVSK